jgi:APA family basic amino acid/polyamine antiporter
MANLFIKKDLKALILEAQPEPQKKAQENTQEDEKHIIEETPDNRNSGGRKLSRSLTAFNLVMIGIGAILGAGIFSLTGTAAAYYAGPGIVYSFVIGGVLCAFSGLCYAEMAAMVPVAGSAYTYAYATLGEFAAWIIGWDLVLEYAFGAVTVATSWSGYFFSLITKTMGWPVGDELIRFTKGPWEPVTLSNGLEVFGIWNLPASLVAMVMGGVLCRGIQKSAWLNGLIVILKLTIISGFVLLGWGVVDPSHWIAQPGATGLARLVPAEGIALRNGVTFTSFGWPGVLTGAGVVFFSYIGFDAVSTTAQECRNPSRDLPIGILGSLFICTALYIFVALVLTGVVPYQHLGVPDPVAVGGGSDCCSAGMEPSSSEIDGIFCQVRCIGRINVGCACDDVGPDSSFLCNGKRWPSPVV